LKNEFCEPGAAMILVLSNDSQVHRLSREVLADLGREQLLARPDCNLDLAGDDDICVVDCSEAGVERGWKGVDGRGLRLYVVDREQASRLPTKLPLATVGVLVKPLNRSALRLSLEQALDASAQRGNSPRISSVDRDDILQSLLHAYLRLQEHENSRAAFLSRVLHDFRAPLTAINGYCGLFVEDALGPLRPKQRDALLRMQRSATRLSRLALSLFELSMRDRVATEIQLTEGSIAEVVEQAADEIRSPCQERDILLSIDLNEPTGKLFFDAVQIEQAVINLLENAVRSTPRHGSVELRGYPCYWSPGTGEDASDVQDIGPNGYRIDIRDFGSQIPAEVLPFVFEEYYSDGKSGERSNGGLGLAITRAIIRGHHGDVWAESGADGAVFSIVLPAGADAQGGGPSCGTTRQPGKTPGRVE
jgi:signal transduction histidine kinase